MSGGINSLGASTYGGLSGLVSGMDTESMVEKLLSGTQAKIDSQKAQKQQLFWKQELYRDVISSVKNLKDTYFDFLKPKTNISSNAFFQSMTSTVSDINSDYLSVVGTTSAQEGNFTIKSIDSVATSSKFKSTTDVTSDIKFNIDQAAYDALKAADKSPVIKINVDGIEKEISLDTGDTFDLAKLKTNIEEGLKGTGVTLIDNGGGSFDLDAGTRNVVVYADDQQFLDVVGVKSGTSNQIRLNMSLKDINFKTQLQGSQYAFKINGVEFSFNENETIGSVIDKINSSDAGVEVKYSSVEDKFVISSTETGAGNTIEIEQITGNLMTAMFGDDAPKQLMSGPIDIYGGQYKTTALDDPDFYSLITKQGGSLQINVDGKDYTLRINAKSSDESDYTKEEVIEELNSQLKNSFGTKLDGTAKMSFELSGSDLTLNYEKGTAVTFVNSGSETDLSTVLGLENKEVTPSDIKLTGFGFNVGETIKINETNTLTIDDTTSLQDIIDIVGADNLTFDAGTKTIMVKGDTTISSDNKDAMKNLFDTEQIDFTVPSGTDISAGLVAGTNAKFTVVTDDGTEVVMEKNTNSFTIDGLSITLKKPTIENGVSVIDKPIEITTTRDTEQILDGLVKFVDDYNKVVEKLNSLLSEEPNYKKYAPLTDAQKEEMSENEIKLWEEKSKEGLLRGDSIVGDMLTEMRSILYNKPEGAQFALYEVGISTSENYKDNGKLIIKEDELRNAIENNSSDLQKLFANEDGIGKQFDKVMDKYIKSSVATPGRLVERAGIKAGFSEDKNYISRQIQDVEKGLKNLEYRYEMERSRYWKQFTSMEKVIQQMNSQSSWLMQQFA